MDIGMSDPEILDTIRGYLVSKENYKKFFELWYGKNIPLGCVSLCISNMLYIDFVFNTSLRYRMAMSWSGWEIEDELGSIYIPTISERFNLLIWEPMPVDQKRFIMQNIDIFQ